MTVTTTDRTTAGNAYATALTALIAAYVTLAATERALLRGAIDPPGGRFGAEVGDVGVALRLFRHPVYALSPEQSSLESKITAAEAAL
jgi:hypothetical protein